MNDSQKYEALSRLQRLLDRGVRPKLAACGLPVETIRQLKKEGLVQLYDDQTFPNKPELERLGVHELTDEGKARLIELQAQEEARQASLLGVFASGWRNKLVEMLWGAAGLVVGAVIGWHLHRYFGTD